MFDYTNHNKYSGKKTFTDTSEKPQMLRRIRRDSLSDILFADANSETGISPERKSNPPHDPLEQSVLGRGDDSTPLASKRRASVSFDIIEDTRMFIERLKYSDPLTASLNDAEEEKYSTSGGNGVASSPDFSKLVPKAPAALRNNTSFRRKIQRKQVGEHKQL